MWTTRQLLVAALVSTSFSNFLSQHAEASTKTYSPEVACRLIVLRSFAESHKPSPIQLFLRLIEYGLNNSNGSHGQLLSQEALNKLLQSPTPINPLSSGALSSVQHSYKIAMDKALKEVSSSDWKQIKEKLEGIGQVEQTKTTVVAQGEKDTAAVFGNKKIFSTRPSAGHIGNVIESHTDASGQMYFLFSGPNGHSLVVPDKDDEEILASKIHEVSSVRPEWHAAGTEPGSGGVKRPESFVRPVFFTHKDGSKSLIVAHRNRLAFYPIVNGKPHTSGIQPFSSTEKANPNNLLKDNGPILTQLHDAREIIVSQELSDSPAYSVEALVSFSVYKDSKGQDVILIQTTKRTGRLILDKGLKYDKNNVVEMEILAEVQEGEPTSALLTQRTSKNTVVFASSRKISRFQYVIDVYELNESTGGVRYAWIESNEPMQPHFVGSESGAWLYLNSSPNSEFKYKPQATLRVYNVSPGQLNHEGPLAAAFTDDTNYALSVSMTSIDFDKDNHLIAGYYSPSTQSEDSRLAIWKLNKHNGQPEKVFTEEFVGGLQRPPVFLKTKSGKVFMGVFNGWISDKQMANIYIIDESDPSRVMKLGQVDVGGASKALYLYEMNDGSVAMATSANMEMSFHQVVLKDR